MIHGQRSKTDMLYKKKKTNPKPEKNGPLKMWLSILQEKHQNSDHIKLKSVM